MIRISAKVFSVQDPPGSDNNCSVFETNPGVSVDFNRTDLGIVNLNRETSVESSRWIVEWFEKLNSKIKISRRSTERSLNINFETSE